MYKKFLLSLNNIKKYISEYLMFNWEFITEKPIYLAPLRLILIPILILHTIGSIQIRLWPRKFKDWAAFEIHLETLMEILKNNNQSAWAERIDNARYISQSGWEVIYELKDELNQLYHDKISKDLKLRKPIRKGISYLNSI